jgi:transcriptional regulator with XRE-family HTH domain
MSYLLLVDMHAETESITRLRRWRLDAGLSLAEVSDLVGVAAPVLSRVERGIGGLKPLTKVRIARSLGVPIRDLFEIDPVVEDETNAIA